MLRRDTCQRLEASTYYDFTFAFVLHFGRAFALARSSGLGCTKGSANSSMAVMTEV